MIRFPKIPIYNFQDFSRPIITTCETGEMAALGGKLIKDMGYCHPICSWAGR